MEIEVGATGQFDVVADGEVVASKRASGLLARLLGASGFPEEEAVVAALRERRSARGG